jgi:hypothetical protein
MGAAAGPRSTWGTRDSSGGRAANPSRSRAWATGPGTSVRVGTAKRVTRGGIASHRVRSRAEHPSTFGCPSAPTMRPQRRVTGSVGDHADRSAVGRRRRPDPTLGPRDQGRDAPSLGASRLFSSTSPDGGGPSLLRRNGSRSGGRVPCGEQGSIPVLQYWTSQGSSRTIVAPTQARLGPRGTERIHSRGSSEVGD